MSTFAFKDDWIIASSAIGTARPASAETLAWATSISRSRVSTVDGLEFSDKFDVEAMNSLESLLHTVEQLNLKRFHVEELEEPRHIDSGETFHVSECKYKGSVMAVKRIRLDEVVKNEGIGHLQRRLQSVLREVLIMCHPPLAHHPNIVSLLGYGWTGKVQQPLPFVSVEFASMGTLREYMREGQSIRTKLILMGDVGAGVMALHKCGIVHGDLKMDNVVVFPSLDRPSGSIAKVSDFGHSILFGSTPEKPIQYFGTALYNAPEVANQRVEPIPPEQLHKCDIWAFGLCVWEILADGKKYFEFSSGSNHIYERPPPYSDTRSTGTSPSTPISHIDPLDEANQPTLDLFDHSKLENLGVEFVEGLEIPGLGFEKGMLRPLLKCTLQTDPSKRLSDLTRLPVIGLWNRTPGRHSLQSKLATYAFSGDIRYSIFSRGEGPHIIWEQQQQLLQEFEAEAQRAQPEKDHGRAAFQTMLCYVNAFGTSANLAKASLSFRGAKDAGHMIACVLEPRMLDGLTQSLSNYRREYSECLALGFNIVGKSEKGSSIDVHRGDSVTRFENYSSFRDILLSETGDASDTDGIDLMRITRNSSSGHFHPLEFAVQHGDLDLVKALLPGIAKSSVLETGNELLLVQAASRGHGAIVSCLLRAGAPIFHDKSTSLLHWLFCLDKSTLDDVRSYLQERPQSPGFRTSLNKVCSEKVSIHAQWPFQVQGTPLATAIASGHVAAVKALLALQADPLSPAFGASESDLVPGFTPIHLAIQYNSPEMLQLLWQAAFGEDVTTGARLYTEDSLGTFPIACALSLLTNAERFAVHGSAHKENMRNTIKLLSFDILLQSSPEGNNALAHAIDLEDADGVELLLEHCPMLASRKLGDPDNEALFTYQFHFAVQIGSNRDTDESIQILESILKLDPTAINRPDSSSVKPLHIAAMGTFTRTTEFLLDHGASCQDIDGSGQGPLHFCRNASNVTLLLSNGANIDHKDQLGFTATHAAAKHGKEEVLRTLVNAGANLSVKDNENGTPLHRAIHQKSRSMVEILINAGAEVNATNIFGQTPLLVAMETGQRALVTLLIDQDMDPFAEDERGLSPFCLSLAWRTPDILSKFQTHRKFSTLSWEKKIHVLYFASTKGEPAALKQYLSKLPAPSLEPNNPQGPYIQRMILAIHKAAVALRVDLVNVLLSGGFNVNSLDNNGNTPLLRVCQTGRENVDFYTYPRTYMCQIYSKTELISLRRIIWALHLLLLPKNVQIIR